MSRKFVILFLNCYSVISVILLCKCERTMAAATTATTATTKLTIDLNDTAVESEEDLSTDQPVDAEQDGEAADPSSHNSIASLPPNIDEPAAPPAQVVDEEPRDANDINNEPQVTSSTSAASDQPTTEPVDLPCTDTIYPWCFHGGTCVVRNGNMICLCPPGYSGQRCEIKHPCKLPVIDGTNMTGDEICALIGRDCDESRGFQCACHADEYFVFKEISAQKQQDQANRPPPKDGRAIISGRADSDQTGQQMKPKRYSVECPKVDKCVHIQCKQLSERCDEGQCVCNKGLGYMRDPTDGRCRLLDPCRMPQPPGKRICGEADCVATYDSEYFECFCPIGYDATHTGEDKSTTRCVPNNLICDVPLLNNCQHKCELDPAGVGYKCSCFPGYRPGNRSKHEDHMCFFEDPTEDDDDPLFNDWTDRSASPYIFRIFPLPIDGGSTTTTPKSGKMPLETITYDPIESSEMHQPVDLPPDAASRFSNAIHSPRLSSDYYIQRIPASEAINELDKSGRDTIDGESNVPNSNLSTISAHDRCKANCFENEICVQIGQKDWYKCQCDRQGYVKVGDQCLDWCSAAELNAEIKRHLKTTCYSGKCRSYTKDYPSTANEPESSVRPEFECDCSTSSFIFKEPETNLCKLNFSKILDVCNPGNAGYEDCVVNKNAYCAVLHKTPERFYQDLQNGMPDADFTPGESSLTTAGNYSGSLDKNYVCICSPEKKFVIDVPRAKARCINECDLLNNECGRFNKMCRNATINPDDFGAHPLLKEEDDTMRINFEQTGCECLPGFKVRPEERAHGLDDDEETDNLVDMVIAANDHQQRGKRRNINTQCYLDYDVMEFNKVHFKAPTDFYLPWVPVSNPELSITYVTESSNASNEKQLPVANDNSQSMSSGNDLILQQPAYMDAAISDLPKHVVFVNHCKNYLSSPLSLEAYQACIRYRYWIMQKLRLHFTDWREVMKQHLNKTLKHMNGNIKVRINSCNSTIQSLTKIVPDASLKANQGTRTSNLLDPDVVVHADLLCDLTLHAADDSYSPRRAKKVLWEKQFPKFTYPSTHHPDYYLMAPSMLIKRESRDNLNHHLISFAPCQSLYSYCDEQTRCEVAADLVNYTCTCKPGYTPIGSRDLYYNDSRKQVCEDINECLFDVCKPIENVSTCVNEPGDYWCMCNEDYVGNNKDFCTHACNSISCDREHGECVVIHPHRATCLCKAGYKESDCSKPDPEVAQRKATMIIIISIFTSVVLLAITSAISLNSQLKKTKRKIKKLEAATGTSFQLFDLPHQTLRAAGRGS